MMMKMTVMMTNPIYVGIPGRASWALPGRQRRGGGITVDQLSLDLQYPVISHNYAPDYQFNALESRGLCIQTTISLAATTLASLACRLR
jgi:hypothetical protein